MPTTVRAPRAFCQECGCVVEDVVPAREYQLKDQALLYSTQRLQQTESRLEAQKNGQRRTVEADPLYPDAVSIFEYWRQKPKMPNAKEFSDVRLAKVMARLHAGHTVAEIKLAIDGCEHSEWHLKHRQTDLELICRDEPHLSRFQSYVPSTNGAGPDSNGGEQPLRARADNRQVARLEDRCARLEREKQFLADQLEVQTADSAAWRASYHEALDYLTTLKSPLAAIAEDSVDQRFSLTS